MKSAIVSGATGFVGTHLCKELISCGIEVTALARSTSNNLSRLSDDVNVVNCGMDDYDKLDGICADTFFHLAWEGTTGTVRDDECLQIVNVQRTVEALHAAKRLGCKRFVALGTVYENLVEQIVSDEIHRRSDFYLLSKRYARHICDILARKLDIEFVWATIFQPIGKYIKAEQVMSYAIWALLNGDPPKFGPALEPYDITAVEDIAYGLRLLGESELSQSVYYIGSGSPMRMKEYLYKIRDILNVDTELQIGALPDDGMRFSFDWYDLSDISKDTGYYPRIEFNQAVLNTAEWIKKG